ncbi:MAG: carbohydrate ABC transporter permease [Tepidisphaeraceae bacterium]
MKSAAGGAAVRVWTSIIVHAALVLLAFVSLLPFLWMLCAAFKQPADIFESPLLPWGHLDRLTLDNFAHLTAQVPFTRWLINSLFLASTTTVSVVTLSSLAGFALAKYRFRAKRPLMLFMLGTMLLPSQVILGTLYELIAHLGWINSYLAILVPGSVSVFGAFLFRQAILHVPDELIQSARLDGCSEIRIWWEIALPLVRPTIGAYTLMSFLASWSGFLWPQIVLQDEAKYTLPIGLNNMLGLQSFLQRDFVAGLTSAAVKG